MMEDRFLEAGAVFICDKGLEYYVIITYILCLMMGNEG